MKSKSLSNYIIAAVVVVCSLVLVLALTIALSGARWRVGGRTLQIDFRDATGVKPHSPVRFAGAIAGSVLSIRYLSPQERQQSRDPKSAVRVTVGLIDSVPPIPSDVVAGLASETVLGEKFVALTPQNPEAPPLQPNVVIQGKHLIAPDTLLLTAQRVLENLTNILANLNRDYPKLIPKVSDLLSQGSSLLGAGSNFVMNANETVTNVNGVVTLFRSDYGDLELRLEEILEQGSDFLTNTDLTLDDLRSLVSHADSLVVTNESNLRQLVAEMRVVSQNLKVITTYTKALTATLGEKPSRLIWGRNIRPMPSEQEILQNPQPFPMDQPKSPPSPGKKR